MLKNVAIVGAGINGLLTAFLITENYPKFQIDIYDAEKHPSNAYAHKGVTYGSRDARHITGSESIGYENSIHKDALRNTPKHEVGGWLLKSETELTPQEKHWREKFEATYIGLDGLNELDFSHAELNYKGLAAWDELIRKYPFIGRHVLNRDGVDVYFTDETAFNDDLVMETEFCNRYFKSGTVQAKENEELDGLYSKKLVVPGLSLRVMSLANDLLNRLETNKNVRLHWESSIKKGDKLKSQIIVWSAGVTHAQPTEYQEQEIQGIVGCWVTIPNRGYGRPFKIAAPSPSAYMNFTPDTSQLHISGGFGWTGEHVDASIIKEIAIPMAEHFVEQINKYLGTNIKVQEVDYCVRPSTPTGLPLRLTKTSHGKLNIFITGSGKSGTTHAPALSEYVLEQINNYGV
ncbi:MAG TPA: FAD/NAD(P)-binding protein [Candidatus Saccharimonadales bacterium]|jgi:glycine/D-amino acid oxidase-like deaminating enzyme